MSPVRVLLVSGSLRAASVNGAVVRTAAQLAPAGVQASVYDGVAELPPYSPDADAAGAPLHAAVVALRDELARADAILFCTPEYAGTLPGSFKNLLDWTVGGGETYGMPVAWINASGPAAPTGGRGAHAALRAVLTWTGTAIIEDACRRVQLSRDQVASDGMIADAPARAVIAGALAALVDAVRAGEASHVSAEAAVLAADERFFAALRDGDADRLQDAIGDTFVIVDVAAGEVHSRGEFVSAVRDGTVRFAAIASDADAARVRLYGPFAIVIGSTRMTLVSGAGRSTTVASRYTHVFELDDGTWRLVSAQGTPIAGADGAGARTETRSVETEATAGAVLAVLADPGALPRWAPAFADEVVPDGERWRAVKDGTSFALRAEVHEAAGTVDFLREIAPGREGGAYVRVIPRPGGGAVVTMTLPLAPGADPEIVRATLAAELAALVACAG